MSIDSGSIGGSSSWWLPSPASSTNPLLSPLLPPLLPVAIPVRSAPEPSFHPQISAPNSGGTSSGTPNPYALPAGSTLSGIASGTRAQPFDVVLSQLATAVYKDRLDPPPGWTPVNDADIAQHLGIADQPDQATRVDAWRHQFLGGGEQTTAQEFKAEIYRDADGNFVLSYRGTEEGMADWQNNFKQGTGFETDAVDKFSGTAVNTAVEFKRVFGDGNAASNLAITGHSQGGGLATVGSLASGVPAVTFDASGIHPNTLDRMGLSAPLARSVAEGGQIRAYSLESDALTNLQEGSPIGLLAPDALGTKIVVKPAAADEHHMFDHYGRIELKDKTPEQLVQINGLVEAARNTPFVPVTLPVGVITGGSQLGGSVAYSLISHSPNALTAAMIDREPWQAGYENPSNLGKDLQNLVPDVLKDDFAENTHETAADIVDVVNSDFRDGNYVQGGFSIYGDLTAGAWNSFGDTANRTAEGAADFVDRNVGGPFGGLLAGTINLGGDVTNATADVIGGGAEVLADGAGVVAQKTTDFVGWMAGR